MYRLDHVTLLPYEKCQWHCTHKPSMALAAGLRLLSCQESHILGLLLEDLFVGASALRSPACMQSSHQPCLHLKMLISLGYLRHQYYQPWLVPAQEIYSPRVKGNSVCSCTLKAAKNVLHICRLLQAGMRVRLTWSLGAL